MWDNKLHKKLLQKQLTRREFLQFLTGSVVVLLGFGNLMTLIKQFIEPAEPTKVATTRSEANDGFGSRKFGV